MSGLMPKTIYNMIAVIAGILTVATGIEARAQSGTDIPILPTPIEAFDDNGIPLAGRTGNVDGIMILSSTDLELPTFGRYSNLSLRRTMRFVGGGWSNSGFARHGTHNFDISMRCDACQYPNSWVAVADVNLLGNSYHFRAYFGAENMIYDNGGSGNRLHRYVEGGVTKFRFIRSDGLVAYFGQYPHFPVERLVYPNGEVISFAYEGYTRLSHVLDMFGNELRFEYLAPSNAEVASDIDRHRTVSRVTYFRNGTERQRIDYEYVQFQAAASGGRTLIPRALSRVVVKSGLSERILEGYSYQYLGNTFFIDYYVFPTSISHRNGVPVRNFSVNLGPLNAFLEIISVSATVPGGPSHNYTLRNMNENYNPATTVPATNVVSSGLTDRYFVSVFPSVYDNGAPLSHPWTQQIYCDPDNFDTGYSTCPLISRISYRLQSDGTRVEYGYDGLGRINRVRYPEGNIETFTYNERGFPTSRVRTSKDGLNSIIESVSYSQTCANYSSCNQPLSITDANGNNTQNAYDPVHGGITSVTSPPNAAGVRAQRRFQYRQYFASVSNGTGGFVADPRPVWLVEYERSCMTSSTVAGSCSAGSADEVVTQYEYNEGSPSTRATLLLRGVVITSGGTTLRTCYSYDEFGRRIGETPPSANLGACP